MGTKCEGLAGKLFGHDYEAIYEHHEPNPDIASKILDKIDPKRESIVQLSTYKSYRPFYKEVLDSVTDNIYVQHVCTRCGDVVKREG